MRIVIIITLIVMVAAFLFWRYRTNAALPVESRLSDTESKQRFEKLVLEYFEKKGKKAFIKDGKLVVAGETYGIQNLAEICNQNEENLWPEIIKDHFENTEKAKVFNENFKKIEGNFNEARKYLSVTIWPKDYVDQIGIDNMIHRIDLPGTATVLVFDLPNSVESVGKETVKKWGKTTEELFKVGLDKLSSISDYETDDVDAGDGVIIHFYSGDSHLVAAQALALDSHHDCVGKYGALIGIPTRHFMLCFPINDAGALKAPKSLIAIIVRSYQVGPGSISDKLYWYDKKRFIDLPYSITGKQMKFFPPDEFVKMLNELVEK